ncbi:MAG: PEGA domain-containing protein, partial [Methanoregulaceae archaeon]|nr:PEGA domain-containing protein [Methanoregulaceae archaeon]
MTTGRNEWPVILLLILFTLTMITGCAAADTRTAAIGERVSLSGKAVGYNTVYLFMTGPGVPSAGSRMDSSVSPVVTGNPDTFTQVPVNDGYWNYSWNMARVSGGLAEGEYTIYAATGPVSAHDLSGVPYSDLLMTLYRPSTTGSLSVLSSPSSAQVSVNRRYAGDTPLNLTSLSPGDYTIEVSVDATDEDAIAAAERIDLGDDSQGIPTLVSEHLFDTGSKIEALKGKPLGTAQKTSKGEIFFKEESTWDNETLAHSVVGNGKAVNFAFQKARARDILEKG